MRRLTLVRPMMRAADRLRRLWWRWRGTTVRGVVALAYTPDGALILVRQTYTPGWCLPGGGRRAREAPVAAALRELREEAGVFAHGGAQWLGTLDERLGGVPAKIDYVRVVDAQFRFRPSLEVEEARAFPPDALPPDLNPWSARFLAAAG
ncbi:NUDIX domain-containing protein [Sphingomonas morindae]|uniref:NUDIX domain-containing protein n=1 Tax=Sphingomonas morindae TaxID=1541170 RepID=A0ABY4X3G4_9SPHN|nr:NUDIX domain-containing protein [Sphingomonas morindae]USI71424.1 NUDIX domain-containing protein [Sphingomonas morindae]